MVGSKNKSGGEMFGRFKSVLLAGVMTLFAVVAGNGQQPGQDNTAVLKPQPTTPGTITLPADTPASLHRKIKEIESWTPKQVDRLNFALQDVTRIVRFTELGLGDRMEAALPRQSSTEWSGVNSVRLHLGKEKTAVVARFRVDTLAGPRVQGEGTLSVMGIHGDTLTGPNVKLERTMSSTGRLDLLFPSGYLFAQLACCGIPPTFAMDRYGSFGDTVTLIFTFDPSETTYKVSLIGREAGRTFPGFSYGMFRTERGEFHRDLTEYPYLCNNRDSNYVNLYFGGAFRGRKSLLEPILKVDIF
jgi:hypothetical protein